ncbi:MAG: DNA-directed RNA polymerase subunit alpha [Candidatus Firestonebacteria bacterium]|nr:DNA-directed RNA polymerase subunit alpha [Candidatus Firestonebacteria bacterium]
MRWKNLVKPERLEYDKETLTPTYGKFVAEPFERGFGVTIGNSLRRILLSSIQAAAVTSVKIAGAVHEFSSLPGVVEDTTDIILNLKELKLKLHEEGPKTLHLNVSGEREVTAADIQADSSVEIINPGLHLATLSDRDAKLEMEIEVDFGRGYVMANKYRREDQPIGTIPVDAIFTPVTKVKIETENTRVGQITDYDKVIVEIWTDGRISPEDALGHSAKILKDHMTIFINFEEEPEEVLEVVDEEQERLKELMARSVEEMELSVRSGNCLKTANIKTIGDLVHKSEAEMLRYRNFGRKSLNEIKEILSEMGLSLGMDLKLADSPEAANKKN